MKHPLFQKGETCYACIPVSTGMKLVECEITGPLIRRVFRDVTGARIGRALAYTALPLGSTQERLFSERDLRKKWERSDWGMLRGIYQPQSSQPKRESR